MICEFLNLAGLRQGLFFDGCGLFYGYIESETNEDEIEVKTETLSLKATPLANGYVKAKTGDNTTDEVYQNWYNEVYLTSTTEAESGES